MKFLFKDNDELDTAMDNLFRLSGVIFATACHYMVARILIRYARYMRENGIDASLWEVLYLTIY